MQNSFGKLFSEILGKNNKSQKEISEKFGVSPSYISKIIKDEKTPTLDFLKKTLLYLRMTPEEAFEICNIAVSEMDCFSVIEKNGKIRNCRDSVKNKMLACVLLLLLSDELASGPYVSIHGFSDNFREQAMELEKELENLAKNEFTENAKNAEKEMEILE